MEINLDLVHASFDESSVALDAENNVSGVLTLTGTVDGDWIAAFDQSGPPDAPWRLEDGALSFGPIPAREFAAYLGTLRDQIKGANDSVEGVRHRDAMAQYLEAEERARAYALVMEALGNTFGRRLSAVDGGSRHAA